MVFMAFKADAFKEFLLPNSDNIDYQIYIDKNIFNTKYSFNLKFEIVNQKWTIKADRKYYSLSYKNENADAIPIKGSQVITVTTNNGEVIKGLTFDNSPFLVSYEKIDLRKITYITVGKSEDNHISYDFLNVVSKNHCFITVNSKGGFSVSDTSANGVFLNHKRIHGERELVFGDLIEVFGLKLLYLNDVLAVDQFSAGKVVISESLPRYVIKRSENPSVSIRHREKVFNRSPRVFPSICTDKVVIEAPTTPQNVKKKSLFLTIGPSFTMAIPMLLGCGLMIIAANMQGGSTSAFMYTGLITAVGSAIFGGIWGILNYKNQKQSEVDDENQRFNMYSNYLIEMSEKIKGMYSQNYYALHKMYPSVSQSLHNSYKSSQLWSKNPTHKDFLFYRLGTGDIDFQVDIKIPDERFSLVYDSLSDKPSQLYNNFRKLKSVPVGVDFSQHSLYGIAGGRDRKGIYKVVNNLIGQIAYWTSYTDVKIAFCMDGKNNYENYYFEYVKWLPHVWNEGRTMRYYAKDSQEVQDVLFELSNIIRARASGTANSFDRQIYRPHYFLFVSDIRMLDGELISKYVFDTSNDYGLTTVLLTDYYQNLPNTCENIIQNDDRFRGFYNVNRNDRDYKVINFDSVSVKDLTLFAKGLSNLTVKEVEDDNSIPSSLSFLEMYSVNRVEDLNILEQWRKNRTFNSMRALIGKKAGNVDCFLDIHEKHHGPHGLVAGTTGSGKSELIQTYMLSLAINYSPDDIAFFVIDFKGGGMANLFSDLPHMAGQISNLSGNQISRAMISIKSENIRRQRIFSEYGVNNINLYTRLYKDGKASIAIPHLLIVIDEFAELKKEEPEFMKELISVAQVGRSLGVHLILATQKPSGTVDDNIWSNSKFRLCLRVQDRQDSNDMLHKSDAAYITQAGRCYLQVGNDEIYELFQSGYSGAAYDIIDEGNQSEIATMITSTGKPALVGSFTKMKRIEDERNKWYSFIYETVLSLYDDPSYYSISFGEKTYNREKIANEVIRLANQNGFHVGDSDSDVRSMINFMKMMPQSGFSTAEGINYVMMRSRESNLKLPELKEKTQLEAVVDMIKRISEENGYRQRAQLWMPLLEKQIYLFSLVDMSLLYNKGVWKNEDEGFSLSCVVGEYDDPQNQTQLPLKVDFAENGHLAVCGSIVTGKSTFLQTMIYSLSLKYSPKQLNLYILDFSSGMLSCFEKLPHCGGVVRENDQDRVSKLFNMIKKMTDERKALFSGGNFSQYVRHNKDSVPAVMIVIDNFASFKEKTNNAYEDILIMLSREGVSYGIYLAITAQGFGISEIQNRIGDNIKSVISLEMSDKFKYMDVMRNTRIEVMPEQGVKGRGIAYVDGRLLEFQTALAVKSDDDYKRNALIDRVCRDMDARYTGRRPRVIPFIPSDPVLDDLCSLEEYKEKIKDRDLLPFAYNQSDASVYSIDLKRVYCYMVNGKRRTGKTNVLKLLMHSIKDKNENAVVIETKDNNLSSLSREYGFKYLKEDIEIFEYFSSITNDFIERNKFKRELISNGMSDDEIYEKMKSFAPIYIFIDDFVDFINHIYRPSDGITNMSGFFENVFEKGYMHNICFFASIDTDESSFAAGLKCFDLFTQYKTGVHLGGYFSSQRIFNFQNIGFNQMSKGMKRGEGTVPSPDDDTFALNIVVPNFGGTYS